MLNLRGADAERERCECAVRRGVRVATNHRHSRQRCALLRPDYMHDAAAHIAHFEVGQAVFFGVGVERLHLRTRHRVEDHSEPRRGRRIVVWHRDHAGLTPQLATGKF